MQLTIENDLSEMPALHKAVLDFCDQNQLNEDIVFALDLCLEEMITNIIKYGHEDEDAHWIRINLEIHEGDLIVEIRDDGRPFDPTQCPEPQLDLPLEQRPIGGLGIHLVRSYVNSMEYRREADQNVITLKKTLNT